MPLDSICVCSNETASKGRAEDSTQNIDLALPATTDAEEIARRLKLQNSKTGLKDPTAFTAVHDNNFIATKKRMYMTATPCLYTSDAKKKAVDKDLMLWSMDDAEIFGVEFFYIGFCFGGN